MSIATQPDQFAYDFMKKPGYMSVKAGEVIYIIKCLPVNLRLRRTEDCYEELPVFRGNDSYFLTPRTRILKRIEIQVTCNPILPVMYEVDGVWYKFLPISTEAKAPNQIKPNDKPSWDYKSIGNLATSGIYSQQEIDQLKNEVMFPADRPAILNILARKMNGMNTNMNSISLGSIMDPAYVERVVHHTWDKFWKNYTKYGTYSAGIIMTLLIYKFVKIFLSTVCNMFALHSVYGWSYHLFASCWSGATNLYLHRYHRRQARSDPEARIPRAYNLLQSPRSGRHPQDRIGTSTTTYS